MFVSQNQLLHLKRPLHIKKPKQGKMTSAFYQFSSLLDILFTDYVLFNIRALNDSITSGIRLLNTIALALKAKRNEAGALNLASPEIKIHLDSSETTGPIDVEQKQLLETNSLVEEFMLLANISVASKINEAFPQTAVLRYINLFL